MAQKTDAGTKTKIDPVFAAQGASDLVLGTKVLHTDAHNSPTDTHSTEHTGLLATMLGALVTAANTVTYRLGSQEQPVQKALRNDESLKR